MGAEDQIFIAKKQLSPPGTRIELTLSDKAIALVLDRILARQNRIASQTREEDCA